MTAYKGLLLSGFANKVSSAVKVLSSAVKRSRYAPYLRSKTRTNKLVDGILMDVQEIKTGG